MSLSRDKSVGIVTLKPNAKNLNCQFVIVDKIDTTKVREGQTVHHFLVADGTGAIQMSIWGALGESIKPGDIMRLNGGWCSLHNQVLHLYLAKTARLTRIGHFTMLFTETPNLSLHKWPAEPPAHQAQPTLDPPTTGNFPPQQTGQPLPPPPHLSSMGGIHSDPRNRKR